jgi:hypothetical protein
LTWAAMPGRAYQFVFQETLTGDWLNLPNSLTNAGPLQSILSYTDSVTTNVQRFYKVKLLP